VAVELTARNQRALYVPERFAHGYQVLQDETTASYEMGASYEPSLQGGLPFDDPRLGIAWPLAVSEISMRDATWPSLASIESDLRKRMVSQEAAARAQGASLA
jgi:dTDP-4-dehydrorhamnose 3,5-epimerase